MAIPISTDFNVSTGLPIDSRVVAANTTVRNAIPSTWRFDGLQCYVVADQENYQLQGGLTNANWVSVNSAVSSISASWVSASAFIITAQTASYVISKNIVGVISSSVSASWASSSLSASYLKNPNTTIDGTGFTTTTTAKFPNGTNIDNSGNANVSGTLFVGGGSTLDRGYITTDGMGNLTIGNNLTVNGDLGENILTINGAATLDTGNITTDGLGNINAHSLTGSLFGTSSYSVTASYVMNAAGGTQVSCSWASSSLSASYAKTASYALNAAGGTQVSCSWASSSLSASYFKNANTTIDSSGFTTTATANFTNGTYIDPLGGLNIPIALSRFPGGTTIDYSGNISDGASLFVAGNSTLDAGNITTNGVGNITAVSFTGSLLGTASYATTASYALNGGSGGSSLCASWASSSLSSSYFKNANTTINSVGFSTTNTANFTNGTYIDISGNVNVGESLYVVSSTTLDAGNINTDGLGGLTAVSFTGSLLGTASYATTSSYALNGNQTTVLSASWVSASAFITTAQTSSYPWFQTGSNVAYVGGNVGAGATVPGTKISLGVTTENTVGSTIAVYESAGASIYGMGLCRSGSYGLGLYASSVAGTPRVYIQTTGNVGIGTKLPANALDVVGNISCSVITASVFNNSGYNIPIIQAGSSSVSAGTSAIVTFNKAMPNTNYAISLTGESTITGLYSSGKKTGGFTASFSIYTGNFDWIVVGATQ